MRRSPAMTGPLKPSPTSIFQTRGGPDLAQVSTRPVSLDIPLRSGPRNWGQSAALESAKTISDINKISPERKRRDPFRSGLVIESLLSLMFIATSFHDLHAAETDGRRSGIRHGMMPEGRAAFVGNLGP